MLLAKTLSWYKQRKVQEMHIYHAQNKEISIRYGLERFGKRPNILVHPADILDFAKKRATSFHCSEESWQNAMMLNTGMAKKELDDLRIGWDLILDIDCKYWPLAKLTTHMFIEAIKEHGVSAVSVKFSGNKGFHIAVPFEAFPERIHGLETKNWFPEGPQRIARYLLDMITEKKLIVKDDEIILGNYRVSWERITKNMGLTKNDISKIVCAACGNEKPSAPKTEFMCNSCGNTTYGKDAEFLTCSRCKGIMKKLVVKTICKCGSQSFVTNLDVTKLIELDTLLISSRHSYRMPYSMHEKSMLVSCPVDTNKVLEFNREDATPDKVDFSIEFMNRNVNKGEASKLVTEAFDHSPNIEVEKFEIKQFDVPKEAIPEENFPPCIKKILAGLIDGKKRSQFILQNFLKAVGWPHEMIEERLKKWNEANQEPLRQTILLGSLRYAKQRKDVIPPPNCKKYYQELGICSPDNLCNKIRNPVQYAKAKNNKK